MASTPKKACLPRKKELFSPLKVNHIPIQARLRHQITKIQEMSTQADTTLTAFVTWIHNKNMCRLQQETSTLQIRNLNPKQGLLNGTRLIVLNLGERIIEAQIIAGKHKGECVFIPRITLTPSETTLPFTFQRRQFSIRPAFQ